MGFRSPDGDARSRDRPFAQSPEATGALSGQALRPRIPGGSPLRDACSRSRSRGHRGASRRLFGRRRRPTVARRSACHDEARDASGSAVGSTRRRAGITDNSVTGPTILRPRPRSPAAAGPVSRCHGNDFRVEQDCRQSGGPRLGRAVERHAVRIDGPDRFTDANGDGAGSIRLCPGLAPSAALGGSPVCPGLPAGSGDSGSAGPSVSPVAVRLCPAGPQIFLPGAG